MREAIARFGHVKQVIDQLQVIEVLVDNDSFVEGPLDRLTNQGDPAFYALNKRELKSIILQRAWQAARRLADAEPKMYRDDISKELLNLMKQADVDMLGDVAHALEVWSAPGDQIGPVVLGAIRRVRSSHKSVPESMIRILVRHKEADVVPILDELWHTNPTEWESLYGETGVAGEKLLLTHVGDEKVVIRLSAIRLLGRVGVAERSLPVLEKLLPGADGELKITIDRAVAAIRSREVKPVKPE